MIETTKKPSELISDRAADRLLADIAVDVDSSAAWAERMVRDRIAEPVSVDTVRVRSFSRFDQTVRLTWRVSIIGADICIFGNDMAVLNEAVADSIRRYQVQARVNRQMAEVEAADRATRDDGEATAGTLPIVSIGPSGIGGEYQNEVRP
jgi:hypothetical protein